MKEKKAKSPAPEATESTVVTVAEETAPAENPPAEAATKPIKGEKPSKSEKDKGKEKKKDKGKKSKEK